MKRNIIALCLGITFPFLIYANTPSVPAPAGGQGLVSDFIKAISALQDIGAKITQKEIALKFEQQLSFPSLVELERIDKSLEAKNTEKTILTDKIEALLGRSNEVYDDTEEKRIKVLLAEKQEKIDLLQSERAEYQNRYDSRKAKQQESLVLLRDELEDLQEEKEKQWKLIRTKGAQVLNYTIIIAALIIFFLALQWLSEKLIKKLSININESRQKTLIRINRIIFKVILVLIILGLFFSQLSTFLPFLAIIGTGLAFAVRDIISSFLAWFVIGGDRGYKTGQIIEIDDVVGKVIEVKPLITVLEDRTYGYPNGKLVSFPNKVVFEGKVVHHSHNMGIVPVEIEFLFSEGSDLDTAEKKLLEITLEQNNTMIKMVKEKGSKIVRQTAYENRDLETTVWSEVSKDGIVVKVRSITDYTTHDDLVLGIKKDFTRWVNVEKNVSFHFTNVGRNHY